MSRGSVSAILIVRDEERCLGRCLDSVADLVDESIVVDTGSTDATIDIGRQRGARIERFTWVDDFAAARNAALAASRTTWNLCIDADEWIVAGGSVLTELPTPADRVGSVRQRSTSLSDGVAVSRDTVLERLLPGSVRYRGRIHEQPIHGLPVFDSGLVLGHDGYEETQSARKRGRNETLLRADLRDDPDNPYLLYQLGKDLQAQERYDEAAETLVDAYRRAASDAPWRHSLVVRAMSVSGRTGRFADALDLFASEAGRWDAAPDFSFAAGNLLLDLATAEPDRAPALLPLVEQCWLRALEIGDTDVLPGCVSGRGSHLAAGNLAAYHQSLGHDEEAARYAALVRRLLGHDDHVR